MQETTIGQLLINTGLPEDLRRDGRVLDKKGIKDLLQEVADKYPDRYRQIAKHLSDVGRDAAFTTGGYSFGLRALRQTNAARQMRTELGEKLQKIYAAPGDADAKESEILATIQEYQKKLPKAVMDESLAENNPLARQALSGARGNPTNVNSLRGADLLYTDHRGQVIPIPVMRSYSMGLRPFEYFAGAFGARKGVIDLKAATQDAGFFAKQLVQAAHRLLVSGLDDDRPHDPAVPRGLPATTDDPDSEGALLAHPVGDYARNTVLTPKILKELRTQGVNEILVRSPLVGGPIDGGVYARDVGVRERGGLAPLGDYVGIAGAQALAEPVTQAQISSKHCLVAGTPVRMADWSVKPIERICVGDVVLGADRHGNTFPVKVCNVFANGLRDCVRTGFRFPFNRKKNRIYLESTLDHKVLMLRKVSSCKQEAMNSTLQVLPVGTKTGRLRAVIPIGFTGPGIYEPMAPLIGLLLGDGCYTDAVDSVNFSCFDDTLAEDPRIVDRAAEMNLKLTKLQGHPGYYKFSMINDDLTPFRNAKGQVVCGTRNPIRRWLEDRGMFGKYAHEKTLPPEVHTWNNTAIAELLGCYFATDGSVYLPTDHAHRGKPYFSYGSTSELMLLEVKKLLAWRFGIYATGPFLCDSPQRKHPMFYLNVNTEDGIRRFHEHIPLYGVKNPRAVSHMQQWRVERNRPYFRLLREKPESIGQQETYDIEVDHPDHLFVLENGLIVSNSGGIAGASAGAISGFKYLNQLVQVPKVFQGGASHAQLDGVVTGVREAPQGGYYVDVNGQEHYVPHGAALRVKRGDAIEAGDTLSEGIPNPAEIVKHKGIGEGRRYFTQAFRQALKDSNTFGHRRNIELLSRGLINHVRLTDEIGDWSPDDVVPYQYLESQWKPRDGYLVAPPNQLKGYYLEKPVLHYSVGTKIQPSMLQQFSKYGVSQVTAHRKPPPFEPEMIRGMSNAANDPDWMTRMLGSYQQRGLLESVHRGATTDEAGSSYVPALARGENFGRSGLTKGWQHGNSIK